MLDGICDRCGNAPGEYVEPESGNDLCALCAAVELGRDYTIADVMLRRLAGAVREAAAAGLAPVMIRKVTDLALDAGSDETAREAASALASFPDVRAHFATLPRKGE